jgi:uncharacterized protein (DUF2267 family)
MSATGLPVFDETLHETHSWLNDIMRRLDVEDRQLALVALRATLYALRDRIGARNAAHFGAQLPMLIRGLYYEGWHVGGTPTRECHKQEFLAHVARGFGGCSDMDPEIAARAVFETIWEHVELGEIVKVLNALPADIRMLWQGVNQAA